MIGHPSRLAVLRVLAGARHGLSGRRVADTAGINHQAAANALKALAAMGLAEAKPAERAMHWTLREDVELVRDGLKMLFHIEERHSQEFSHAVRAALGRGAEAAVLVGAAAKGHLRPGDPVDMIVVCEPGKRRELNERLVRLREQVQARFGLELRALVLARKDAVQRLDVVDGWQLLPREGPPDLFVSRG